MNCVKEDAKVETNMSEPGESQRHINNDNLDGPLGERNDRRTACAVKVIAPLLWFFVRGRRIVKGMPF